MTGSRSTYQLFTPSGCLSVNGIGLFMQGTATAAERALIQKHLDRCSLCRDACEGMTLLVDKATLNHTIQGINQQLSDKLGNTEAPSKIKAVYRKNLSLYFAVAASIVILVSLLFFVNNPLKEMVSQNTAQEMEVEKKVIPQKPGTHVVNIHSIQRDGKGEIQKSAEIKEEPEQIQSQAETKSKTERSRKVAPNPNAIKPNGSSLEAFMEKEESHSLDEKIPGRYPDIASTQTLVYYLAEVTVSNSDLKPINLPMSGKTKTESLTANETLFKTKEKSMETGENEKTIRLHSTTSDIDLKNRNELVSSHFFNPVEVMPEFPGGYEGLNAYLSRTLNYPEKARKQGLQGRVLLSFIIDEDGHPTNIKVVTGIDGGCDEEAVRVISAMPAWKPATQNGKIVPVMFTLPVNFKIL